MRRYRSVHVWPIVLALLVFVPPTSVLAQGTGSQLQETFRNKNGRYWADLPRDQFVRSIYVAGFLEGWAVRDHEEETVSLNILFAMDAGASITHGELSAMVDAVYAEPENMILPIGWVVMASLAVHRGDTTRDVVLAALRKHVAEINSRQTPITLRELSPIATIRAVSKRVR